MAMQKTGEMKYSVSWITFCTWMRSQKWQNDPCSFSRQDLQNLLELTPQKDVLFLIEDWNAKVGSQEIPGETGKFGLGVENETGQRLIEFCQENSLVIANTLFQQHKRRLHMAITSWSILKSDWLYSLHPKMEKLYAVSKNNTRSWLWLKSWIPYCKIQT